MQRLIANGKGSHMPALVDRLPGTSNNAFADQVSINNYTEIFCRQYAQLPALSISMKGCMEMDRGPTASGYKYNSYGGTATGLTPVADSLTAIRYMVFDKKLCTAQELYDSVQVYWEGYGELRQQIISAVPHYGNNAPDAGEMMKWVCNLYYDICKSHLNSETVGGQPGKELI